MKKILVAVDGSENSRKAILKTKELAKLNSSDVVLLHVVNDVMNSPYITNREYRTVISKAFIEQGNNILRESLEEFKGFEGNVRTEIKFGDPGKLIVEMAEKEEFDLVVMGSRGLNAISRAMLGSVSNKVLNNIHVSVLIVK